MNSMELHRPDLLPQLIRQHFPRKGTHKRKLYVNNLASLNSSDWSFRANRYLFHCDQTTFKNWTVQILNTALCIFHSFHSDKTKATGFSGTRIGNQMALQNLRSRLRRKFFLTVIFFFFLISNLGFEINEI